MTSSRSFCFVVHNVGKAQDLRTVDRGLLWRSGCDGGGRSGVGDPGGETKFGISKRSYPSEDIKNLTLERAKAIYRKDFWVAAAIEGLPDAIRFDVFDVAVNSGVGTAVRMVQKVVGVQADGVLGPVTLQACNSMPLTRLIARFNGARLMFMADLTTWPGFGRGWARRVASNLLAA